MGLTISPQFGYLNFMHYSQKETCIDVEIDSILQLILFLHLDEASFDLTVLVKVMEEFHT